MPDPRSRPVAAGSSSAALLWCVAILVAIVALAMRGSTEAPEPRAVAYSPPAAATASAIGDEPHTARSLPAKASPARASPAAPSPGSARPHDAEPRDSSKNQAAANEAGEQAAAFERASEKDRNAFRKRLLEAAWSQIVAERAAAGEPYQPTRTAAETTALEAAVEETLLKQAQAYKQGTAEAAPASRSDFASSRKSVPPTSTSYLRPEYANAAENASDAQPVNAPPAAAPDAGYALPSYARAPAVLDMSRPVHVEGYTRRDGTYVQPHTRSSPHHRH